MKKYLKTIVVGSLCSPPFDRMFEQTRRVYSPSGLAPTLHTCDGGHLEPKIIAHEEIIDTFQSLNDTNMNLEQTVDSSMIDLSAEEQMSAEKNSNPQPPIVRGEDGKLYQLRIRKLSERECFRLMDVDEENIDKIQAAGISRSQQYKMAGNSIVVNCLYHIFDKLLCHPGNDSPQMTLFD